MSMKSRREDQSAPPCARGTGKGGATSQRGCGKRVLCARGGCRPRIRRRDARAGDGARVARTSTRTPCALISSAISTERSLDERWRMASRWSNLRMPSLKRLLPRHANHLVQSEHGVAPRLGRLREFRQLRRPALTVPYAYGGGSRAGRRDTRHADARDGCDSAASSDPADVPRDPSFVRAGGRDDWRKCDQRQFLVF